MNKFSLCIFAFVAAIFGSVILGSQAQALEFGKPIKASILINRSSSSMKMAGLSRGLPSKISVTLMNLKLSTHQKQALLQYPIENMNYASEASLIGLPRQAEVGMNGVPVLDQGQHGSCVTFANTAAVDALLGRGDYLSQLCNLSLGSYFEQKAYLPSGWDGSLGPYVLNQIIGFGIINKDNQRTKTCGGLKEYPLSNPNTVSSPMSLDEFKQASENLNENLFWDPLLSFYQRFQWDPTKPDQANILLTAVKKILATPQSVTNTRLTFAALLPVDYCSAGACASYHAEEDTWALTKAITQDNDPELGGHEMIIIGYNDDAIASDHDGIKHRGLLILRNSWGSTAGDHGNYYMSYDFFKKFVVEVQQVVLLKE